MIAMMTTTTRRIHILNRWSRERYNIRVTCLHDQVIIILRLAGLIINAVDRSSWFFFLLRWPVTNETTCRRYWRVLSAALKCNKPVFVLVIWKISRYAYRQHCIYVHMQLRWQDDPQEMLAHADSVKLSTRCDGCEIRARATSSRIFNSNASYASSQHFHFVVLRPLIMHKYKYIYDDYLVKIPISFTYMQTYYTKIIASKDADTLPHRLIETFSLVNVSSRHVRVKFFSFLFHERWET